MKFDRRAGRWSGEWTFVSPGGRRSVRPLRHYVYTLDQWRDMLRAVGLRLTGAWSGYAQPYRPGKGPRLLVAGTKPGRGSGQPTPRSRR